jgi:hypothetical protein
MLLTAHILFLYSESMTSWEIRGLQGERIGGGGKHLRLTLSGLADATQEGETGGSLLRGGGVVDCFEPASASVPVHRADTQMFTLAGCSFLSL